MLSVRFATEREHLVAEHLVADACQQGSVGLWELRQWELVFDKLVCHVVQVGLIEHAVPVVGSQCLQIVLPVILSLTLQTQQVGLVRKLVSAYLGQASPQVTPSGILRVVYHPVQQRPLFISIVADGEYACCL